VRGARWTNPKAVQGGKAVAVAARPRPSEACLRANAIAHMRVAGEGIEKEETLIGETYRLRRVRGTVAAGRALLVVLLRSHFGRVVRFCGGEWVVSARAFLVAVVEQYRW
jgi:hypothetical protein